MNSYSIHYQNLKNLKNYWVLSHFWYLQIISIISLSKGQIVIAGNVESSCSYSRVSVYVGSSKYTLSAWYVCEIKSPTATVQEVKDMKYWTYFNILVFEQPFGVVSVSSVVSPVICFFSLDKFLPIVIKFDILKHLDILFRLTQLDLCWYAKY